MRDNEPVMEEKDGVKTWRLHGVPHREGGPAIQRDDGSEEWYWHGKLHRQFGGPALTRADGTKEWWLYGERHNEPGPAIERPDGSFEYWVFGRKTGGVTVEEIDRERRRQSAQREREINRDISSGTSRDIPARKPIRFKGPGGR
jgi:hypothetical protein